MNERNYNLQEFTAVGNGRAKGKTRFIEENVEVASWTLKLLSRHYFTSPTIPRQHERNNSFAYKS
jgi:hypothetical protein